jgi:hypothetical protein
MRLYLLGVLTDGPVCGVACGVVWRGVVLSGMDVCVCAGSFNFKGQGW